MGQAIADYHHHRAKGALRVFSPMFEEDEIPLPTLFRTFGQMPPLERRALQLASGRVADVGAGAGCHTLYLQEQGLHVTAIDISPLAVQTMQERGVRRAVCHDFFSLTEPFDTLLMLMNGIGLVGKLNRMPAFFAQLDKVLAPGGQVLCDSSDLRYLYEDDDGTLLLPDDVNYYGEMHYTMQYADTLGHPFHWLYIDADTLRRQAALHGYEAQVIAQGEHYDYLARITRRPAPTPPPSSPRA